MLSGWRKQFEDALASLVSALSSFGHDTLDRRSFRATICAAALIGFLYGALVDPLWSEAVEFGQVWAGTVKYDPCNTWYPVVLSSPSLQITLLLDTHGYPVKFPVSYFQFGQTGLYLALLPMALIAAGRHRSGAFFGGLLTGVHLVWAVALILAALPAVLRLGVRNARISIGVFLAAAILALSLQWAGNAVFPSRVDALCTSRNAAADASPSGKNSAPLRNTFTAHNLLFAGAASPLTAAVHFFEPDVLFALVAAVWIFVTYRRGNRDPGTSLLIMASVPISAAALFKLVEELDPTFYVLAWLDPRLPSLVLRLIVTRWLNLSSVLLPILALSTLFILTRSYRSWWMAGLATLFAVSMLKFAADAVFKHRFLGRDQFSPLVAVAREDAGQLIISPGVVGTKGFNPQLRTGRAIIVPGTIKVVDPDRGAIAVFCYTDYSLPFAEFYSNVRPCFEKRAVDEWEVIAAKVPATGLIAPSDWRLSLPVAATGGGLNYHRLP